MANDVLSQDEIDALLKGVDGATETPAEAPVSGGVRDYDLATQERIVRGRMPALEIINDRFARLLRIRLLDMTRRSPEISIGEIKVVKFSEFLRNLVVPTNLNVMQVKPLRGTALFVFEPNLVFAFVETMFGGTGRQQYRIEGREFTATEQRIISRLLAAVIEEYQKAWAPVRPLTFDHVRSEMHTQFANVAAPNEIVVISSFTIGLGNSASGAIHLCIPYATLEPIRDILHSPMQGDRNQPDRSWMRVLTAQVQMAEVELTATLARIPATIGQIMKMRTGDVISFDRDESVVAEVDGVPIFDCRYGTSGGQYALRVEKVLAIPQADNTTGE